METNLLRKHFDQLIQHTENLQLSKPILKRYKFHYEEIFLYCCRNHLETFTDTDAADFCRLKCPERKHYDVKETTRIAYITAHYFGTGSFEWKVITFTNYPVCEEYESLVTDFREEMLKKLSSGTVRVGMVIIRQFLYFLEQSGKMDIRLINNGDVLGFIRQEASNHKGSMPKLLRTVRKFICFLRSKGIVDLDVDRFLKNAGRCRQKALPCFTEDEIRRIFSQIDRSVDKGRRDYAIFLLALRTGLRACDIAGLRLSDIDWQKKVIRVVQKKTRVAIELPLPVDAGNAVADYILHSRYETDNPYVFLRLRKSPSQVPVDPTSFNYSLRRYAEAAGITREGWDGKTFHALRRTAGTRMVEADIPVSTVAQILGHNSIESSKRYISLDTRKLAGCGLDLGNMRTRKEGLA